MSVLQLVYRDRRYRLSVAPSRRALAQHDLTWLQELPSFSAEAWAHGQFAQICKALECSYGRTGSGSNVFFTRLQRNYMRGKLELRIPLSLYFHATVFLEDLLSTPAFREHQLSLQEARNRLKGSVILGTPATPDIYIFFSGSHWLFPADVPRPVAGFSELLQLILDSSIFSTLLRKEVFGRVWDACVAAACPEVRLPSLSCRRFGRVWRLVVSREDCLSARLAVEDFLQDMPEDVVTMELSWAALQDSFPPAPPFDIPPSQQFVINAVSPSSAPAARAPRHYPSDVTHESLSASNPEHRGIFWCRLCDWHSDSENAWHQHCSTHGGFALYRQSVLAAEASAWPTPVDPKVTRHAMRGYAACFWDDMGASATACASCALPASATTLRLYDLRADDFQLQSLHSVLSASAYAFAHRSLTPVTAPATFQGLSWDVLCSSGVRLPAEIVVPSHDAWLLHLSTAARATWDAAASSQDVPLCIHFCAQCAAALAGSMPRLPSAALANGNLCLPMPSSFADLSFAERLFIARGFTVRRLQALRGAPDARQQALTGNTISFPQNSADIFQTLPCHPDEAAELLTVFFPSAETAHASLGRQYVVRRAVVRAALVWLQMHNPFYCDVIISDSNLDLLPVDAVPSQFLHQNDAAPDVGTEVGPADAQLDATAVPLALRGSHSSTRVLDSCTAKPCYLRYCCRGSSW